MRFSLLLLFYILGWFFFFGTPVRVFSSLQFNIGKAAEQTVRVDVLVLFKSEAAPSLISVAPYNLWKKLIF